MPDTGVRMIIVRVKALIFSLLLASLSSPMLFADGATPVLDDIKVDFDLLNRDGLPVRYREFRGMNVLLAFGFTHCAHICPLIAANMAKTLKVAEKNAVGIFISVDTERDTPAITDDYARRFSDRITGLGGSYEQVSAVAKNFKATFAVTKSQDHYTVQHTPSIFLIGPDAKVIDVFAMNAAPETIAAAMK